MAAPPASEAAPPAGRAAEYAAIVAFGQLRTLPAPVERRLAAAPDAAPARKRLARTGMLYNVLMARFPETKLEDVRTMAIEWLEGAMEATFAVENAVGEGNFSDDEATGALLSVLDAGATWVHVLVGAYREAGRLRSRAGSGLSVREEPAAPISREEAARLLSEACASGCVGASEALPEHVAPEIEVLGVDVWEALCWRRGSLRYYVVSTRVKEALALLPDGAGHTDDAQRNRAAGRAVGGLAQLIDDAVDALSTLLDARPDPCSRTLSWGIYSTTHLLALAYLGELCAQYSIV
jgi:hypothetical protein